jgi:hypothetical protein
MGSFSYDLYDLIVVLNGSENIENHNTEDHGKKVYKIVLEIFLYIFGGDAK